MRHTIKVSALSIGGAIIAVACGGSLPAGGGGNHDGGAGADASGTGGSSGNGGVGGTAGAASGGTAGTGGSGGSGGSTGGTGGIGATGGSGGSGGSGTGGVGGSSGSAGTGGTSGSGGTGGTGGTAGASGAAGGGAGGSAGGCGNGETSCGGTCVDTTTDVNNCGSCYDICGTPSNGIATCTTSKCGVACNVNYGDCDADATNGCEADLLSDAKNCGACGRDCLGGGCQNGMCQPIVVYTASGLQLEDMTVDTTRIYWTDGTAIYSIAKSGGAVTTLVSGLLDGLVIALDSSSVYWLDYGAKKVAKVSKAGGTPVSLSMQNVGYVAITTDGSNVYWMGYDASNNLAVMKVPISGGTTTVLATDPNGLLQYSYVATDSINVYIASSDDYCNTIIEAVPTGGGALKTLVASHTGIPGAVATDGSYVYWSDSYENSGCASGGTYGIFRVPVAGGQVQDVETLDTAPDMVIDGTHAYWAGSPVAKALLDGSSYAPIPLALGGSLIAVDDKFLYFYDGTISKVAK